MLLKIFTDGGARGNPGPGAIGVVVYDETNNLVTKFGQTVGGVTNNTAEYLAVKEALLWVKENTRSVILGRSEATTPESDSGQARMMHIKFYLDSLLVASQLGGVYKIKDANLKKLFTEIQLLTLELQAQVSYTQIPREQNKLADEEVNKALDKKLYSA